MRDLFFGIGIISFIVALLLVAYSLWRDKKDRSLFLAEIGKRISGYAPTECRYIDNRVDFKKMADLIDESIRLLDRISRDISSLREASSGPDSPGIPGVKPSPPLNAGVAEPHDLIIQRRSVYVPAHASENDWESNLLAIWNERDILQGEKLEKIRAVNPPPERVTDAKEEALKLGLEKYGPLANGEITLIQKPKHLQETSVFIALPQMGITLTRGILSSGWFDWEGFEGHIMSVHEGAELLADLTLKKKGKIAVIRSRG